MSWILHIGTQKTGSQAIQRFLDEEIGRVRGAELYFPRTGRVGRWHRPLFEALQAGDLELLRALRDEVEDRGSEVAILSHAALYLLDPVAIEALRDVLGDCRVVLFLRRQDQLSNSMYNQMIKAHRISHEEILDFEAKLDEYNPDWDHGRTLQRWEDVFGRSRILPVRYEKEEDSISRLLGVVGLEADLEGYARENPNPALDAMGLAALREAKRRCWDRERLPDLVSAAHALLSEHFVDTYTSGDHYLLDMTRRRAIVELYRRSNERVRERYFPDSNSLFSDLEEAEAISLEPEADESLVARILHEAGLRSTGKARARRV